MTDLLHNVPTTWRWRTALRAGVVAAALAVVVGAPLSAQAFEGPRGGGHGPAERHEAWRAHEWREHHAYWGGYGPRYYAPAYGYYAPAPGLNFTIR
jgi:hypothetical protein